jgi:cytoskeletal protein CcmA (bactofilin family)
VTEQASLQVTGWLGVGATWKGDLTFTGRVRIDGTLIGTVRSDDLLDIGAAGRVEGNVEVAQALVGGVFNGTLRARERVTLLETAVVKGELHTPWLDVRNGAQLEATVNVTR